MPARASSAGRRSTYARLSQLPAHKQLLSLRPAPSVSTMVHQGGVHAEAARELMETPPDVDEKLGRRGRPEWQQSDFSRSAEYTSLVRAFQWLDKNRDGFVDAAELYEGQRGLKGHLSRQHVGEALWEVDDDLDAKLSMDDFIEAFYRSDTLRIALTVA
ncbi:MAG: hypothetical protein SGPRY_001449, partial [Prymnesium sp.]